MSCDRSSDRRRRVIAGLAALGAAIAIAAGCGDICSRSSDCASGLVCTTAGACVVPPADSSCGDAGCTSSTIDGSTTTTDAATGDAANDAGADASVDDAQTDARVGT